MEDRRKEKQLCSGTRENFMEEVAFEMNLKAYVGIRLTEVDGWQPAL